MTRQELLFRAGLTRFLLGLTAMVGLPLLYPHAWGNWWIYAMYMGAAAIEQLLIKNRIGGMARSIVAGVVDVAMLTYTVHCVGSVASVVASMYLFAGVMNALVVGLRVGVTLAVLNSIAFTTVVWLEHFQVLAFAPDVPDVARFGAPTTGQSAMSTILVSLLLMLSTTVVGMLVRALRGREQALLVLSQRDPLTNLYNRRHTFERLDLELLRVRRGHKLAVLMLDLDRFKHVNDTQGHLRGDLLLKEIAGALSATTRVVDTAGRYGGDEFMVVLPDSDEAQARVVAERITSSIREVGLRFDATRPVTASVGVALADRDDGVASLLRRADEKAYVAKQRGGDRVVA